MERSTMGDGSTAAGAPRDPGAGEPTGAGGQPAISPGAPTRARRPPPVTFLAALQLLSAIAYGLVLMALVADGSAVVAQLTGNVGTDTGLASDLGVAAVTSVVAAFCVATLAAGALLL